MSKIEPEWENIILNGQWVNNLEQNNILLRRTWLKNWRDLEWVGWSMQIRIQHLQFENQAFFFYLESVFLQGEPSPSFVQGHKPSCSEFIGCYDEQYESCEWTSKNVVTFLRKFYEVPRKLCFGCYMGYYAQCQTSKIQTVTTFKQKVASEKYANYQKQKQNRKKKEKQIQK